MRITLNLATRPYADLRPALKRLRIGMAVLAVLGVGFYFGLRAVHQKAEEARATEQRVQNQIDAINRERQGYQDLMRQPANDRLLKQVAVLNELFDEKTFSWTLAMEDLETVLPGGVQVVSLDPSRDTKTGRITLKLHVVGPRDLSDDLVQNLEHSRHFLLPHIVSEASESTGGPNERLEPVSASNRFNFELLADYNSAASAESAPMQGESKQEKKDEEKQQTEESTLGSRKPMAAGRRVGLNAAPAGPPPARLPLSSAPQMYPNPLAHPPTRVPYTGPLPPGVNQNRNPNFNPNQNRNPNQYPNPGGPQ